jgi:hypothetical protein
MLRGPGAESHNAAYVALRAAGEAVLRIAACEEPFDGIDFDAPPEPATRLQFGRMPGGALIKRRRARLCKQT